MPELALNGLSISKNKVWASNTGRAANGNMVGDLIGIKYKLEATWPPLSAQQIATIDNIISNAFFSVRFIDPAGGSQKTVTCYAGDPVYPVYSYVDGVKTYMGVKVSLIER